MKLHQEGKLELFDFQESIECSSIFVVCVCMRGRAGLLPPFTF